MEIIKKDFSAENMIFKADNDTMTVEGYITTWGNVDSYGDIIIQGAFGELNPKKVKFINQHNYSEVLGVCIELREDNIGIYGVFKFSNTELGRDTYTLAKDGAVTDFSIGFRLIEFKFNNEGNRIIEKGKLMETSVVTFPANDRANITMVKSKGDLTVKDFEDSMRAIGYSQKEAVIITAKAYSAIVEHREGGNEQSIQSESELKEIQSSLDNLLKQLKGK